MEIIKNINTKLELIDSKLDNIITRLDALENVSLKNQKECSKMGNHIDFVENVYENVKHPLGFICKKVKYLTNANDNGEVYLENK